MPVWRANLVVIHTHIYMSLVNTAMRTLMLTLLLHCALISSASMASQAAPDQAAKNPFVWPDGAKVGFSLNGQIWSVDIDGGAASALTPGFGFEGRGLLCPDAECIAFTRWRPWGREFVVADIATGREDVLGPGRRWDAEEFDLPPKLDGVVHLLAFGRDKSSLYAVVASDDGKLASVKVDIFDRSQDAYDELFWVSSISKAGDKGVYARFEIDGDSDATAVAVVSQTVARVILVDLQTGEKAALLSSTDAGFTNARFASNDESVFFIEREAGIERIVEIGLDGKNRRIITEGILASREFAVHPNGESLILVENGKLFSLDLADGTKKKIPIRVPLHEEEDNHSRLLLTNVRVFDGTGDAAHPNANVLMANGLISSVSFGPPSREGTRGARVVDATGRFLMAGLVDSHAHVSYQERHRMPEILNRGITSVIDPGTNFPQSVELIAAIGSGRIDGPNVYSFSDVIDGVGDTVYLSRYAGGIVDPEVGRALVRRYDALGYEGVKLYSSLSPEVSVAVIDEANRHDVLAIGHLGATTWGEAVEAGIHALIHMDPVLCSERVSGSGNRAVDFEAPDYDCLRNLFDEMASKDVTFDPTLIKVTPYLSSSLKYERAMARRPDYPYATESYHHSRVLEMAHKAGVNIVIGRDEWEHSLAYEMEAYESIGIPRPDILRMATVNAARYLRKQDEFGTVQVGMRADLILVDGDPLERIGDLRNVAMVIKDGEIVVDRLGDDSGVAPKVSSVH